MAVYYFEAKERDFEKIELAQGSYKEALLERSEDGKIYISFEQMSKGETFKDFSYCNDEVFYVLKGSAKLTYLDSQGFEKVAELKAGDVVHITKDSKVSFEGTSDEPLEIFSVMTPSCF